MKSLLVRVTAVIAFIFLIPGTLAAATIHSEDGRSLTPPDRFLVEPEGISFLRPGGGEVILIEWEEIDLRQLALKEREIDRARRKALESDEPVYFQKMPPTNFYQAFLAQPIHVTFNPRFRVRSRTRSQYLVDTEGFPEADDAEAAARREGFVSGESGTLKEIVEQTPYPLDTTVEGLFMVIGDDASRHSRDLIRELQKHGAFFENLVIGLRNLSEIYPNDPEIDKARRAVGNLASGRTISVDDQRQLLRFVEHARSRRQ